MKPDSSQPAGAEAVLRYVSERAGLRFDAARAGELCTKVQAIMPGGFRADVSEYLEAVARDDDLFEHLVGVLTVGETYFFREPAQLEFIRSTAIPDLIRVRGPVGEVRAWSAGCATGEEAYTLAILLRELVSDFHVLGTDLSAGRIDLARLARYSRWSLRGVPDALARRHFHTRGKHFVLEPALRRAVDFRTLNLVSGEYPSIESGIWKMDLVLCRNVLIYLEPEAVTSVARRLIESLSPDGWLLLSASDPPLSDLVECETVVTAGGVAYRQRRAAAAPSVRDSERHRGLPVSRPLGPVAPARVRTPAPAPAAVRAPEPVPEILRTAEDLRARIRSLADRGELAAAERECIAALEIFPMDAELTCLQATLFLAAGGDGREAAAAARRAIYLDRAFVLAHLTLAHALSRLEDRVGAGRALRNAVRLLAALPADQVVQGADGESAGQLLAAAKLQLRLLERVA